MARYGKPQRVSLTLPSQLVDQLQRAAAQRGTSLSEAMTIVAAAAVHDMRRINFKPMYSGPSAMDRLKKILEAEKKPKPLTAKDRRQVIYLSRAIIEALQEALDYDPIRNHNQPPPPLRLDDAKYLREIRTLIAELRRLNELLAKPSTSVKRRVGKASKIGEHFNEFFKSYAGALGKGAAGLTIGAAAALLLQTGVAQPLIDSIWKHWKN
jgi:hypothetical protein